MSAPRRSSSPLSSASPSPVTGPIVNTIPPPSRLDLGAAAATELDQDGDIIGGSSPTTLTDALTESELTEDEGDDNDDDAQDQEAPDVDDEDDAVDGEEARRPAIIKRRSGASPSPSLTPPPPSDPPRSEALPSSPLPVIENDGNDDDEPMDQDDAPEPANDDAANDAAEPAADGADGDDEDDGDVTMRAEEIEVKQEAIAEIDEVNGPVDAEAEAEAEGAEADEEGAEAEPDAEAEAEAEAAANGDEEAVEEEEEAEAQEDSPAALPSRSSQHVAPPTPQATRALLALEIKFAALRDRLYVERVEEAAREEEMILNGSHPALLELNKVLESRRSRLHEIALKRFEESLNDLAIWRDVEKKLSWSTWADQRDQIHWEEFEHTWSKRRRLAREKNEIETPKVHKPVPRADKPPRAFNWSAGAIPHKLSTEDALHDLQLMDVRRNQPQHQHASRHASPAVYNSHAGPSSGYSYQQQHPASYLQSDTSEADRRHHYTAPPRQHARPQPQPQAVASNPPPQSRTVGGSSGSSTLPRKALGSDAFGIPRREPPSALQSNGDSKLSNGHGHGRHAPGHNVLGLGLTSGAAAEPKPTSAALGASSASAPNASSRFPGLADYLSGSATPPQNSFQHHLQNNTSSSGPTAAAKSAPSVPSGTSSSLGTSGLGRPTYSAPAPPQPQAASVPRN